MERDLYACSPFPVFRASIVCCSFRGGGIRALVGTLPRALWKEGSAHVPVLVVSSSSPVCVLPLGVCVMRVTLGNSTVHCVGMLRLFFVSFSSPVLTSSYSGLLGGAATGARVGHLESTYLHLISLQTFPILPNLLSSSPAISLAEIKPIVA